MSFINNINFIFTFHNVLMTLKYLGKIKYFIQVGAHDGQMHDPLRHFIINNNWTGLLIEPQKEMYQKCIKNYRNKKNLTFVNVALHPTESTISLYKVSNPKDYSHTGWASINLKRFDNTIYKDNYLEEKVHSMHFMDVIKQNNFNDIDLLQIDTEGYDWDIIQMFDFDLFQPILIQYENCHLTNKHNTSSINYLKRLNYICFQKRNDTFAIRKDIFDPFFFISYLFVRISRSLKSRLGKILC
tara:strand:- start:100 stop:825 length:726 start_codon:yes stop_codon:yes gene_type:complete